MSESSTKGGRSLQFPALEQKASEKAASPLELTASDGTGLTLVSLSAKIVIEAPLAFTELHLEFENPHPRQLEGRFRITLPSGASISRFSMRIGDRWQEGEVVELQAARRAYEDFLHRRQDPALLEHEAGNEFSARVFPIEARARKQLIVSYSQELSGKGAYQLPLRGLPRLGSLEIQAMVSRAPGASVASSLGGSSTRWEVLEVKRQQWEPDVDFDVALPPSSRDGLRSGSLAVVRVTPNISDTPEEIESLLVLMDTSASRALGFSRQLALVELLATGLAAGAGAATPFAVGCFDQEVSLEYVGSAGDFDAKILTRLRDRMALGASNLEQALSFVAQKAEKRWSRVILITDGMATAGETAPDVLVSLASSLKESGVERLDVIAIGGIRDDAMLRRLVTCGLAKDGTVCDGDMAPDMLARKLTLATRSSIKVEAPGASFCWPTRLNGFQPGDSALIYVDIPEHKKLTLLVDGQSVFKEGPVLQSTERLLLERAWIKARIEKLEDQRSKPDTDSDVRDGLKHQITELSIKYRVLCPYTALLVLETEADYARFNIDRKALADILSIGAGGLEVLQRRLAPPVAVPPPPAKMMTPAPSMDLAPGAPMSESEITLSGTPEGAPSDDFGAGAAAPAPEEAPMLSMEMEAFADADMEERIELSADEVARHTTGGNMGLPSSRSSSSRPPPAPGAPPPQARMTPMMAPMAPPAESMAPPPAPMAPLPAFEASPEPSRKRRAPAGASEERASTRLAMNVAEARRELRSVEESPAPRQSPSPREEVQREEAPGLMARLSSSPVGQAVRRVMTWGSPTAAEVSSQEGPSGGGQERREEVASAPVDVEPPMASSQRVPPARPITPPPPNIPLPNVPPPIAPPFHRTSSVVPTRSTAWSGPYAEVMNLLLSGKAYAALKRAVAWREETPGDVLALVALGISAAGMGHEALASRAFGSLIDLFPSRADLRRFAGELLEGLMHGPALELAIDTYRKAVESRPDHPSSHRLLGLSLLKAGRYAEAFEALAVGSARDYPPRFPGVDRILREDLGLAAAGWLRAQPDRREEILARLHQAGARLEDAPSLRFVLVWETDANDVDFHIHDSRGGHAYYRDRQLASGGELYADITQGYGPECFTIRKPVHERAYPYDLQAHYFARGPMGYGMGKIQLLEHDGQGGFGFDERPYVVMEDGAYVELGRVLGPLEITSTGKPSKEAK